VTIFSSNVLTNTFIDRKKEKENHNYIGVIRSYNNGIIIWHMVDID
jgi:hypothetical protein